MYKTLKKFGALLLAVVMLLALSTTAFADVDPDNGSFEGSKDKGFGVSSNNIPVTKSIIIFNPDNGTTVREPNLTYVYTVSPVTSSAQLGTITDDGHYNDNNPVTVQVNAGVAAAITNGAEIKFDHSATVSNVLSTGTEVEHTGNITIDPTKFSHAGVYRYLITETIKDTTSSANVIDVTTYGLEARTANYEETRYLDVYIVNGTGNKLQLSSAVIFKTNTVDGSSTNVKEAITTTTDKTTGYEPGTEVPASGTPDYTSDEDVDRYFTYNLKVGKTTTGALADKVHNFPFEITLTAATTLAPTVVTDLTVNGASDVTAGTRNIANGTPLILRPKMSNGDYIELKGIPKGTTVAVKETNDTTDIYTASWDTTAGTTETATITSDNTSNTDMNLANGKSAYATAIAIDGNQSTGYVETVLGFTNNLSEISPTGVVLRIAPYVLILGAGFLFLAISKRRKEEADEA